MIGLLLALFVSRWLAFPSTIWDQDEANFALAILHFDPLHNQPHPPFFPLWVGLGKMLRGLLPGVQPQDALRIVSVIASIWIFFPLRSLWNLMMSKAEATAAAALFLFMPAPWLFSGRAYSGPTATAFLVAGLALWIDHDGPRRNLLWGALALASSVLIRPQWFLLVLPLTLWRVISSRGLPNRSLILGPPVLLGLGAGAILVRIAGGLSPLLAAVEQHRHYMLRADSGFSWSYPNFAVNRALGGSIPGTVWMILALIGAFLLLRTGRVRKKAGLLIALVLLPQLLQLLLVQNPTLPRYAIPLLALSCGLVVAGLKTLSGYEGRAVIAVWLGIVVAWIAIVPSLSRYRQPSPVMAAWSFLENSDDAGLTACDRRLVSFVTMLKQMGALHHQIIWDYQIELGMITRPYRLDNNAIFTGASRSWIADAGKTTRFSCDDPLLRRVAGPHFLDLSVVRGCSFVQPLHPSIKAEQLQPGAVIPPSPER